MNIRAKITLIFFSIVIVVLSAMSVAIYLLSANYRQEDFYRRLKNRAINTAKVLVEVKEVNADLLRRLERNNPASLPSQYIAIYDAHNELLYNSDATAPIPIDTSWLIKIRQERQVRYSIGEYEALGFIYEEGNEGFTVLAVATDVYGLDALQNLRNTLIAILLVSLLLISVLGWFYAGRVLKPISSIVDEVSTITEENLSRRLIVANNHDELGKLANTFNRMLHRLQNAFISQKTFIANASHEIKTPITVMAGEIEVTLLQDREKSYYVRILRSVLQSLRGLNRLSTQLLVLAQTSSDNPQRKNVNLRIDDVIWDATDELQQFHADYVVDIQLAYELNHEALSVNGDHQLLKVAVMNLIDNACKYSDNKTVTIHLNAISSFVEIEFVNSGPGIAMNIVDKIFDPFFRGESAERPVRGFGIGLSLVKQIIQLHGGQITVDSKPHQITKFAIKLPIASRIR